MSRTAVFVSGWGHSIEGGLGRKAISPLGQSHGAALDGDWLLDLREGRRGAVRLVFVPVTRGL